MIGVLHWLVPWLVPWTRRAGTVDFCPVLDALVSPVQNIIFRTGQFFTLLVPTAQQPGQAGVLGRLSLCFFCHCLGTHISFLMCIPFSSENIFLCFHPNFSSTDRSVMYRTIFFLHSWVETVKELSVYNTSLYSTCASPLKNKYSLAIFSFRI
jgi:hypothetical protein